MRFDTFTTAGTCDFTVPAGNTTIDADLIGGGGGGGLSQHVGAGGGGGGQLVRLRNMAVTANATLPVTVGEGAVQVIASDISLGVDGADGASYKETTITTSGTVLATTWPGSVALVGTANCSAARNGGGGASSLGNIRAEVYGTK